MSQTIKYKNKHNNIKNSRVFLGSFFLLLFISTVLSYTSAVATYNSASEETKVGPYTIIAPYLETVGLGNKGDLGFDIGPTGTVSIIYSLFQEDNDAVMYIDNATGHWSNPQKILEPTYVNNNAKNLVIDNEGDIHLIIDTYGDQMYLNNKSGSWENVSLSIGRLNDVIRTNDDGNMIYIASTGDTQVGQGINDAIYYTNISWESKTNRNITTKTIDFPEGVDYDAISFVDMDVNSSGYVHFVFKGAKEIYYFYISPLGELSTPIAITSIGDETTVSHGWVPKILIDDQDQIHITYTANKYGTDGKWIPAETGLFYVEMIDGVLGTAEKIAPHPGGAGFFDISNDGNIGATIAESINLVPQIGYSTNNSGDWEYNVLSNFSYSNYYKGMAARNIKFNPVTNEPVILTTYKGVTEIISMKGGVWGNSLEFNAEISNLTLQYPNNFKVNLTIKNLGPESRNFNTIANISGITDSEGISAAEFENTAGNDQTLGILGVGTSKFFEWDMHFSGAYSGQIILNLLINKTIDERGYFGVVWNVELTAGIPGFDILSIGLFSIFALFVVWKKKLLYLK